MQRTDAIVIGGGQAGLALSRCLCAGGIEHVVLERGRVAERWRGYWDSLRLLTPNWQSRLPGFRYQGPDPDGFMAKAELVEHLERYARSFAPPIETQTEVLAVRPRADGYAVVTDRDEWQARAVVIATGYCAEPLVPALARELPGELLQLTPVDYRNPAQLPSGGVLVVGASSTGVQLAEEIQRSGRQVTLAVGRHTRLPRRYRGQDILWWLDRMGLFEQGLDQLPDPEAALQQPSLQLVGRPDGQALDLLALRSAGVRLVGRLTGAEHGRLAFADDLRETTRAADAKLARLLDRIDAFASVSGDASALSEQEPWRAIAPLLTAARAPTAINLRWSGIRTVIWATGFRRSYPWLHVPVVDARGELQQRGGVTSAPGLFTLGLRFQRTRKSSFLDGVGPDARVIASEIGKRLRAAALTAA
jgi:putative flavoprotein involved in K+ transport